MFGDVTEEIQNENTRFRPQSPYGFVFQTKIIVTTTNNKAIAKVFAYWTAINFRESYGMHISNGILFNHESPRRGENFVTRKITMGVASIKLNLKKCIYLGNLDAKRDWGHAKDYVEAMYKILQQNQPSDYVIATGIVRSVRYFTEKAFSVVGIDICWRGEKLNEEGFDKKNKSFKICKNI
ncbi:hypothetical protein MHBO_003062 [Bonamia ostreae]|uniref:GDP-mannose 4,6-dehydratase n=1 Tax=Bonamia ostreae TaxID=126728 RepID=A0ABV2AQ04_9EUKA